MKTMHIRVTGLQYLDSEKLQLDGQLVQRVIMGINPDLHLNLLIY
jgi:hypothetical protein